jgi:hypothetical protein
MPTRPAISTCVLASAASLALVFAGCGGAGSVETNELPFAQEFSECGGFGMNDDVATIDCPKGELRVLVAQPEVSPIHLVPFRFEKRQRTLVVSAEARAHEAEGGAWGLGCLASEPGEGGRGYLLLVGQGGAGLVRIDVESQEGDRFAQRFTPISSQEEDVEEVSGRHVLRIRCAALETGTVRIRGSVDGGKPLTAVDEPGLGPFTGAVSIVLAERPGTDIRFDDLSVDGTPEVMREESHGDQEARIALVRATAEKTTTYGDVVSVFCQSENAGCVVTYSELPDFSLDDTCQFWHVENVSGTDVATPDEEEPMAGAHGTYSDDNPDAIGCAAG